MSSACGESGSIARSSSLGDHRDGGERRAELVRGGGREPVELREMLLARQHQLGRRQRVGELARFLGDLPGMTPMKPIASRIESQTPIM